MLSAKVQAKEIYTLKCVYLINVFHSLHSFEKVLLKVLFYVNCAISEIYFKQLNKNM